MSDLVAIGMKARSFGEKLSTKKCRRRKRAYFALMDAADHLHAQMVRTASGKEYEAKAEANDD